MPSQQAAVDDHLDCRCSRGFFWLLRPFDYTYQNDNTALFGAVIGALIVEPEGELAELSQALLQTGGAVADDQ